MHQARSFPDEVVASVATEKLRWGLVRDGLKIIGNSVIAISIGIALITLGAVAAQFRGLEIVATPMSILGVLSLAMGAVTTVIGVLHCSAVPEPITRSLAILLVVITVYSGHYAYSVQQSYGRATRATQIAQSRQWSRSDKRMDQQDAMLMLSIQEGNRGSAVLGTFANAIFLTFLMSLMCYFRQASRVKAIQKVFRVQIIGTIIFMIMVAFAAYMTAQLNLGDSVFTTPPVLISGIVLIVYSLCLTIDNTFSAAKVIDAALNTAAVEPDAVSISEETE